MGFALPHNMSKYLIGMRNRTKLAPNRSNIAIQLKYGTVKLNRLKKKFFRK